MRQSVSAIINDCHDKITWTVVGLTEEKYGSGQGIASSKWKHHNWESQLHSRMHRKFRCHTIIIASFPGLETERYLVLLFAHARTIPRIRHRTTYTFR